MTKKIIKIAATVCMLAGASMAQSTFNISNMVRATFNPVNNLTNAVSLTNLTQVNISNITAPTTGGVGGITFGAPTTFYTQNGTSTPQSVRIFGGGNLATSSVAGANLDIYVPGSGGTAINGVTNTAFTFVGTNGIVVTTTNNTIFIGQPTIPSSLIGTNRLTFSYTGSTQYWATPSGVTNLAIWLWGGAAATGGGQSGPGGHTFVVLSTFGGEQWEITVGQGSLVDVNTNGYGRAAFGGGGRGYTTNTTHTVNSGAGGSWVIRSSSTQVVAAAGGAGGCWLTSSTAGTGGGTVGQDGGFFGTSFGGFGGTRTAGGSGNWAQTVVTNAVVMATAGSFLRGGDGGILSNATSSGAGGGGGYYGGGGSISGNNAHSAGGGSGFDGVGVPGVLFGTTYRSAFRTTTAGVDLPFYSSGVGVPNSGNGQVTIGY